MDFQKIPKIENFQFYLDIAFKKTKYKKSIEARINAFSTTINGRFNEIIDIFPSFDQFSQFEEEISETLFNIDNTRKALGKLQSATTKLRKITREYAIKIRAYNQNENNRTKKPQLYGKRLLNQFFGRASSVVKRLEKDLDFLESIRKVLRDFPQIRESFTICISGFPNVGKSTLLSKLTTSKPEVKAHSFTTKNLNIGYLDKDKKIQIIDTPGTLNRNKMNKIELQADIALRRLANLIIYVIDPTEPYPLEQQKQLLKNIEQYEQKIIIYQSKSDLVGNKHILKSITDINLLKKIILEEFKQLN